MHVSPIRTTPVSLRNKRKSEELTKKKRLYRLFTWSRQQRTWFQSWCESFFPGMGPVRPVGRQRYSFLRDTSLFGFCNHFLGWPMTDTGYKTRLQRNKIHVHRCRRGTSFRFSAETTLRSSGHGAPSSVAWFLADAAKIEVCMRDFKVEKNVPDLVHRKWLFCQEYVWWKNHLVPCMLLSNWSRIGYLDCTVTGVQNSMHPLLLRQFQFQLRWDKKKKSCLWFITSSYEVITNYSRPLNYGLPS